jgi:hypothetical protein
MSEEPLYSHAWVQERAQRGLAALVDGEVEIVAECLTSLSDFPERVDHVSGEVRTVCRYANGAWWPIEEEEDE